jgi:hypothetical protein
MLWQVFVTRFREAFEQFEKLDCRARRPGSCWAIGTELPSAVRSLRGGRGVEAPRQSIVSPCADEVGAPAAAGMPLFQDGSTQDAADQVGRALPQLGITHIPSYSPRGRAAGAASDLHQDRGSRQPLPAGAPNADCQHAVPQAA